MTPMIFFAEWAARSAVLIAGAGALLWVARVKDSSLRLAVWTAVLCGSLAIPVLSSVVPRVSVPVGRAAPPVAAVALPVTFAPEPSTGVIVAGPAALKRSAPFDWMLVVVALYGFVAFALLLRLSVGLAMSRRFLRGSVAIDEESCESQRVSAPVTLGIVRPVIVLPADWREWDRERLAAVLAHERSHIRRRDPVVQAVSAVHRAALWFSPVSWFLHDRIVRVAEEASDDAALAVTGDRASYAEMLLVFMQRGVRRAGWLGVPMARYGRADRRITRILEGTGLSRGVTRWGIVAIVALVAPLAWVVAAANPQEQEALAVPAAKAQSLLVQTAAEHSAVVPLAIAQDTKKSQTPSILRALGTVSAVTVVVRARADGELGTISFKEGEPVQAGQALTSVGNPVLKEGIEEAATRLEEDRARLNQAKRGQAVDDIKQAEAAVAMDQENWAGLRTRSSEGSITAPIAGVAGLLMVQPGNMVHAGDAIVTITQMQPIAVVFSIQQDALPEVRSQPDSGVGLAVEAWNRDNTAKIATGRLTAIDNQIDEQTGTVKLKATFDNKSGALFPNQFVNVRLILR